MSGTRRLSIYLKSLGAGLFNLIFAGTIVFYSHMAAFEARFHSDAQDAGKWDPLSVIHPAWWAVIGIAIFTVSFYREFRKLTRKPNL